MSAVEKVDSDTLAQYPERLCCSRSLQETPAAEEPTCPDTSVQQREAPEAPMEEDSNTSEVNVKKMESESEENVEKLKELGGNVDVQELDAQKVDAKTKLDKAGEELVTKSEGEVEEMHNAQAETDSEKTPSSKKEPDALAGAKKEPDALAGAKKEPDALAGAKKEPDALAGAKKETGDTLTKLGDPDKESEDSEHGVVAATKKLDASVEPGHAPNELREGPKKADAGEKEPEGATEKTGTKSNASKKVDTGKMVIDAFEFYTRAVYGPDSKKLPPINKTMKVIQLMKLRQDMLCKVPLPHVTFVAQNIKLLEYGERLMEGLDVALIADELLQETKSQLSMAEEMKFILYLCTSDHRGNGSLEQYRKVEDKLIAIEMSDENHHGHWSLGSRGPNQRGGSKRSNRECLVAAIEQDWLTLFECAMKGTKNILGTLVTKNYLRQLQEQANERGSYWCGIPETSPHTKGASPFHIAIRSGCFPIVKLASVISIDKELANAVDFSGDSLLHAAVQGMDARSVKVLLRSGASVNVKDSEGKTALQRIMTEATKLVAAHDMKASPKPTEAVVAGKEPACQKVYEGTGDVMMKMPRRKRKDGEPSGDYGEQLGDVLDVLVTLVLDAGRSGQTVQWPPGDRGWTVLHIMCAAGGHHYLQTFVEQGADPHALQEGRTLIDTVIQQRKLTLEQQTKTLQALFTGLELNDFQAEVGKHKITKSASLCRDIKLLVEMPRESCTAEAMEQESSGGLLGSKPGVSVGDSGQKCSSDKDESLQNHESEGSLESDSKVDSEQVGLFETGMEMSTRSLRNTSLLASIIYNVVLGDVTLVENLADYLWTRPNTNRPTAMAIELLHVLKVMDKENDPVFQHLFPLLTYGPAPVKGVEEAFDSDDFQTVMRHSVAYAPLTRRELTILMLVAALKGESKVFYECLQRGGSLTGIDSEEEEADGKLAGDAEGDRVSSAATPDSCQSAERTTDSCQSAERTTDSCQSAERTTDSCQSAERTTDSCQSAERTTDSCQSAERTTDSCQSAERTTEDVGAETAQQASSLTGETPHAASYSQAEHASSKTGKSPEKQKSKPIESPLKRAIWSQAFSLSELAECTSVPFSRYVRSAEKDGRSLLHCHACGRDLTELKLENLTFLLSHGADFKAKNSRGDTFLQALVREKRSEWMAQLVRKAVDCGQSIDWTPAPNTWTALHVLAASGAYEHIPFFVEHGADPKVLRSRADISVDEDDNMLDDHTHGKKDAPVERNLPDQDTRHRQESQTEQAADTDKAVPVVTDGLTLVDTAILPHNLPDDRRLRTLKTLLEDLHLGPHHAQVVDTRPEGEYYLGLAEQIRHYRYPLEHMLQPSTVTPRTEGVLVEQVKLMTEQGAVGQVERAAIMDKMDHFRKLPFCQAVVILLGATFHKK